MSLVLWFKSLNYSILFSILFVKSNNYFTLILLEFYSSFLCQSLRLRLRKNYFAFYGIAAFRQELSRRGAEFTIFLIHNSL